MRARERDEVIVLERAAREKPECPRRDEYDCGGRTPLYDTIDTTYSVVALGALTGAGDAVNIDADGTASLDDFPFLDDPN